MSISNSTDRAALRSGRMGSATKHFVSNTINGREVTFSQITVNLGFFKSTAGRIACIGVALNPPVAKLSGEGITPNILY